MKHIKNSAEFRKHPETGGRTAPQKIQRDRLLDTIDTLQAFEVAQIDDADEIEAGITITA